MRIGPSRHLPALCCLLAALASPPAAPGQGPARDGANRPAHDPLDLFTPMIPAPDAAHVGGLPEGTRVEVLTPDRAYRLALIRARSGRPMRREAIDPATFEAEASRLGVGDFARFRDDFLAPERPGGFRDPGPGLLDLAARLQKAANARRLLIRGEKLAQTTKELIKGEASGLSQLELDQVRESVQMARFDMIDRLMRYRDRLDEFKVELGLSPHASVASDQGMVAGFESVFELVDAWFVSPRRDLNQLNTVINRLPGLGDLSIDGRPVDDTDLMLSEPLIAAGARVEARGDDAREVLIRRRLRKLVELRMNYEVAKRAYTLTVQQMDQAIESIISPPQINSGRQPAGMPEILRVQRKICEAQDRLVDTWASYLSTRLELSHDQRAIPATDWPSFLADFTTRAVTVDGLAPLRPVPPEPVAPPATPPPTPPTPN